MNSLRIFLLSFAVSLWGCESDSEQRTHAHLVIDASEKGLGDSFSKPVLRMIYETASSGKRPVSVLFQSENTSAEFVFQDIESWSSTGIMIDTPKIHLHYDGVAVNGEPLSKVAFREFLDRYQKAAGRTHSHLAYHISTSQGVTNGALLNHLMILKEFEVTTLILTE